ncbi:MAG: hypothetical protein WD795_02470 [Woeseia sp.]
MCTKLVRCGAVIAMIATGLATLPAEPAEVRSEKGAPDATLALVGGRLDPLQDLSLLQHAIVVVISDGRVHFPDHNFAKDDFPRQPPSNRR